MYYLVDVVHPFFRNNLINCFHMVYECMSPPGFDMIAICPFKEMARSSQRYTNVIQIHLIYEFIVVSSPKLSN